MIRQFAGPPARRPAATLTVDAAEEHHGGVPEDAQ